MLLKNIVRFSIRLLIVLSLFGCSNTKYVPIERETIVKEIFRDSIIEVPVPIEKIVEVVPEVDTLIMENSTAVSISWLDSGLLRGQLNSKEVKLQKEIQVKEVERVVVQEVPVEIVKEVEKIPDWSWWCLGILISVIGLNVLRLLVRLKVI